MLDFPPGRMPNGLINKRTAMIAGGLLLLLVIIDIALHAFVNVERLRPQFEQALSQALNRQVKITDMKLAMMSGGVTATGLTIADDSAFSNEPFVQAQSVKVHVELLPLVFSHRVSIKGLKIQNPQIALIQSPAGTWNYSSLGAKKATVAGNNSQAGSGDPLQIGQVSISDGRISVTTNSATPLILDKVDLDTKGVSANSAFPFSLSANLTGGGSVQISGSEGPFNQSDTAATPVQATIHMTHLDLAKSGLIDPSAGIGGIANLDAKVSQTGDSVTLDGTLLAEQWKVAEKGAPAQRPLKFDFTINHDRSQQAGNLTRGDIHVGSGLANLTGHYDLHGTIPVIDLTLAAANFPGTDLSAALPAMDVILPAGASVVGGAVTANLRSTGSVDKLTTSGTVVVADAQLSNFDLASRLRVLQSLSGIKASPHTQIKTLRANVQVTPAVTRLDNIQLVVPSIGEVTGAGTVSASHALDFKMRLALTKAVGLIPVLGTVSDLPFSIEGTSQDPKFVPNAGAIVNNELKKIAGSNPAAQSVINGFLGRKR